MTLEWNGKQIILILRIKLDISLNSEVAEDKHLHFMSKFAFSREHLVLHKYLVNLLLIRLLYLLFVCPFLLQTLSNISYV